VDRTALFSIHRNVSGSLLFTWKHNGFKKSDVTRLLPFKAIINQVVRIYVNIRTALSIAVANIDCEGFSIAHILYHFALFFIEFYVTLPYRLYLRNSVTRLCISFNLIIPFLE